MHDRAPGVVARWDEVAPGSRPETPASRFSRRLADVLVLSDLTAVLGAAATVRLDGGSLRPADVAILAVGPVWLLCAAAAGLYAPGPARDRPASPPAAGRVAGLVTALAWTALLAGVALPATGLGSDEVALWWALALVFAFTGRLVAAAGARRARPPRRAVVVGTGEAARGVARRILRHPEGDTELVGFVDELARRQPANLDGLLVLGCEQRLGAIVRGFGVDRVIVATPERAPDAAAAVLGDLADLGVEVQVVVPLDGASGHGARLGRLEALPVLEAPLGRPSAADLRAKRALDLVGAVCALVVLAPLLGAIAALIAMESGRPVLFRQTRLGMDMRPFESLKFRTMRVGTPDAEHRAYIRASLRGEPPAQADGLHKLTRAAQTTAVGRRLRRTSLDELPQLLNVVRGDMSLVGPRPCIPYEVEGFAPHHFERFRVPAGITGLWQVTARSRATFAEALDMDVAYARGRSFAGDLRLLARTPAAVMRRRVTT